MHKADNRHVSHHDRESQYRDPIARIAVPREQSDQPQNSIGRKPEKEDADDKRSVDGTPEDGEVFGNQQGHAYYGAERCPQKNSSVLPFISAASGKQRKPDHRQDPQDSQRHENQAACQKTPAKCCDSHCSSHQFVFSMAQISLSVVQSLKLSPTAGFMPVGGMTDQREGSPAQYIAPAGFIPVAR